MITLTNPFFWFNFLVFIFSVFLSFYIPGVLLIRKINISHSSKVILGIIIGMTLWAWQGFVFGYLHLRFLTYVYLIFALIVYLRNFKFQVKLPKLKRIDLLIVLIIFSGMLIQLIPVIGFGLEFGKGTYLCCANNDDFLYHTALTNSITKSFPPMEPGISGETVKNYHYWSNLVVAELSRVFNLQVFFTQFQFINLFLSLFLGLTVLTFASLLKISKSFTRWLVFLIYFGGDGIFFILLVLGRNFSSLRNVLPLEDGSTFLYNPPRAFSIVLAFAALSLFIVWIKQKNKLAGILSMILFASTVGFKVYTNLFFMIGLPFLIIYFLYKKQFRNIPVVALFFPLTAIVYLSNNASAGGLFWAPFHLANDFIVQPTFNLSKLELARQVYMSHNNYLRVFQYELIFLLISMIAIFGTKIVALFQSFKSLSRLGDELLILVSAGIIGSYFIGSFFLQQSGGANTFNFVVSSWIFLSIPAALALDFWQKRLRRFIMTIIILFILLTSVRVADNTYFNILQFSKFGYLFVGNDFKEAFNFIKNRTDSNSLMIVDPNFGYDRYSPFVEAFTKRQMFVSGEKILESHNVDIRKRQKVRDIIFKSISEDLIAKELIENKIDYILLWEGDALYSGKNSFTRTVFQNEKIRILKVDTGSIKLFKSQGSGGNKPQRI